MKKLTLIIVFALVASFLYSQNDKNITHKTTEVLDPVRYEVSAPGEAVQRTPLFEVFTSSTCPPCKQGNINLHDAFEESDGNWTCIKYQMYWPGDGDPYFTDEGYSRSRLFDISAVPALLIDGAQNSVSTISGTVIEEKQSVPSYIKLDATYTQNEKSFEIHVDVEPMQNFFTPFINLYVGIIENKTTNNVESNGETSFEFVMKKMLPGSTGTSIKPLKTGVIQSFDLSYEFQGDYRLPNDANDPIDHAIEHSVESFDDLSVIVWVQNKITSEVFQSTWATTTSSTDELINSGNGIISVFPNPAKEAVFMHYLVKKPVDTSISLYDMTGSVLYSIEKGHKGYGNFTETIDVSKLEPGTYMLRLQMGEEVTTKKILKHN